MDGQNYRDELEEVWIPKDVSELKSLLLTIQNEPGKKILKHKIQQVIKGKKDTTTGPILIGMIGVWRTVIGPTGLILMISIYGIGIEIGKMRVGLMMTGMMIINIYGICNAVNGD